MNWIRTAGLRLLLSFGLAFALWTYVSFRENPNTTTEYEDVPVEVENLGPGLVLVDRNGLPMTNRSTVTVTADGTETTLQSLRQSDVRAFTDLSGLPPGEHSVPVNITPTRSGLARITFSADPAILPFRIEQEITRTVPLTIEVGGSVPFSFEQLPAQLTSDDEPISAVEVRGPENQVEQVTVVRTTVNVSGLTANYNSPRSVEAVDADGIPVPGVTVTPSTVDVLVPVVSSVGIKRVPVVPQIAGRPASSYVVTEIVVAPEFVTLTGSSGPLESVQSISTEAVDLAGESGIISRTVGLRLPAGVTLLEGQPDQVLVTVRTAQINQPFTVTLPAEIVATNAPSGVTFTINPNIVQVSLSGTAGQIQALSTAQLQGVVDLSGLGSGTTTQTPSFALPEGVTITNEPRVTVTLRPLPSPTPTGEPTATPDSDAGNSPIPEATTEVTATQTVAPPAAATTSAEQPGPTP